MAYRQPPPPNSQQSRSDLSCARTSARWFSSEPRLISQQQKSTDNLERAGYHSPLLGRESHTIAYAMLKENSRVMVYRRHPDMSNLTIS